MAINFSAGCWDLAYVATYTIEPQPCLSLTNDLRASDDRRQCLED